MRTYVAECLLRQVLTAFDTLIQVVEAAGVGGGGGGGGGSSITGPVVTTYNDSRGVAGDWSYDEPNALYWHKVSSAPHTWVSNNVNNAAS
jgi:hypothetical protein